MRLSANTAQSQGAHHDKSLRPFSSWPDLFRPSTNCGGLGARRSGVDARNKSAHDECGAEGAHDKCWGERRSGLPGRSPAMTETGAGRRVRQPDVSKEPVIASGAKQSRSRWRNAGCGLPHPLRGFAMTNWWGLLGSLRSQAAGSSPSHCAQRAARRRAVAKSMRPLTAWGRKWRWNALTARMQVGGVVADAGQHPSHLVRLSRAGVGLGGPQADAGGGEPPPVEQLAGVHLAGRRHVGVADDVARGDRVAADQIAAEVDGGRHLCRRERAVAELVAGIDQLDADRAGVDVGLAPPIGDPRVPGTLAPRRPVARGGRPRRSGNGRSPSTRGSVRRWRADAVLSMPV